MALPSPEQVSKYSEELKRLEKFLWDNPQGGTYYHNGGEESTRLVKALTDAQWDVTVTECRKGFRITASSF